MKIKYSNLVFKPKEINEEQHTIRAVFSTADVDRHGEIVDQKSWILDDFMKNPVVLFGHDHYSPPVGMITGLGYNSEGNLEGTVKFAANEYPFANVVWNLYKGGFMKAFSVGFSSGKYDVVEDQVILKENTLYEISTVSVPANAMALAKSKGLDVSPLEQKFLEVDKTTREKAEEKAALTETVTTEEEEVEIEVKDCEGCEKKDCPCKQPKVEEEVVVEETAEETTTDTEEEKSLESVEEKGEVEDEMADMDEREKKWNNMEAVYDIFGAFARVYYDDNTSAGDFNKLLKETGELFIKHAGDANAAKAEVAEFVKDNEKTLLEILSENSKSLDEEEEVEETVTKSSSVNTTEISIKVETPAVRITVPKKGANKAKLINKAIRALLVEKRK